MKLEPGVRVHYHTTRADFDAVYLGQVRNKAVIMIYSGEKWRSRQVLPEKLRPHPRQLPPHVSVRVLKTDDPLDPFEVRVKAITTWHRLGTFASETEVRTVLRALVEMLCLIGIRTSVNGRKPESWAASEVLCKVPEDNS